MKRQRTKLIVFCVLWAVVVVAAGFGVRYFADPQRQIDRHIAEMRPLFDEMDGNPDLNESHPAQLAWNSHQEELIKLGYLEERMYTLPLLGQWSAQEKLFGALDKYEDENWISGWGFRPGLSGSLEIVIVDEPARFSGWQDVINDVGVAEE